jgi:hypothetical protein
MTLLVDTTIGNKIPSPELHRMLVDLQDTTRAMVDSIEEIRQRAYSEGFNEQQTISLIKSYLGKDDKTKRKLRWILDEKPRREAQKKLTNKLATSGTDANMSTPEPE